MKRFLLFLTVLIASIGVSWGQTYLKTLGSPFDPSTLDNGGSKKVLLYAAGCASGQAALGYLKCTGTNSAKTNLVSSPAVTTFSAGTDISQYVYTISKSSDGTYYEIKDCNNYYVVVFPKYQSNGSAYTGNYGNASSYSGQTYKGDLTLTAASSYDNTLTGGYVYNISSKTNSTGYIYVDNERFRANASGDIATAPAAFQFVTFESYGTYTVSFPDLGLQFLGLFELN